MWSRTSVCRHYSRARCTKRRAPAEEKDEENDDDEEHDVLRQEEDRSVEREREIHVCLVIIIMVRMLICYFGNIIRILSHNKIPVLYSAEDFCSTGD